MQIAAMVCQESSIKSISRIVFCFLFSCAV